MKKVLGLIAATALAVSAFSVPVLAEGNTQDPCVKFDNCTVPGVDLDGDKIIAPANKVPVCHYPGGEDALVTGRGYDCVNGGGIIIFVSANAAAAHGLIS
jgi:hypothetical protein